MEPVVSSLRMAENARLATDMDAERTKVAALQAEQLTRTRELTTARTQEISHKRELIPKSDELEALRKWHARELLELEAEARRRERELHDVNADLTTTRQDLEQERKTATSLKEALAQQGAAQKSLQSQNLARCSRRSLLLSVLPMTENRRDAVSTLRVDPRSGAMLHR